MNRHERRAVERQAKKKKEKENEICALVKALTTARPLSEREMGEVVKLVEDVEKINAMMPSELKANRFNVVIGAIMEVCGVV